MSYSADHFCSSGVVHKIFVHCKGIRNTNNLVHVCLILNSTSVAENQTLNFIFEKRTKIKNKMKKTFRCKIEVDQRHVHIRLQLKSDKVYN